MPFRDWLFRINDILAAISAVAGYVGGMTYEDFTADRKTVDAVVRNLIIVGEAASGLGLGGSAYYRCVSQDAEIPASLLPGLTLSVAIR